MGRVQRRLLLSASLTVFAARDIGSGRRFRFGIPLNETAEVIPKFISNGPKCRQPFVGRAFDRSGIREIMVQLFRVAEEDRAGFTGVVADCYYVVKRLAVEFRNALRAMCGNIDANFLHGGDRFRANEAGFDARTFDLEPAASIVAQQAFRHLASRRISGTEDQHTFFAHERFPSACAMTTAGASSGSDGTSQRNRTVAAAAPSNCAATKPGASAGRMPANVLVAERASVTAGFAKEVEAVNQ